MPITATTIEEWKARFPELSVIDEGRIAVELEEAEADCSEQRYGINWKRAVSFLAAHRLSMTHDVDGNPTATGQPGSIAAASTDGVSATYNTPTGLSTTETLYGGSSYGQRYLELLRRVAAGPMVTSSAF